MRMALWTWWLGDPSPERAPLPAFRAGRANDVDLLIRLTGLGAGEVRSRLESGHRAYVAWLDDRPTAYGWVASMAASIGELDLAFGLPAVDRYLWDFVTLPEWRGRGLYPRLLQAILAEESAGGRRFWIINAPENAASAAGIAKAGFRPVGELSFLADLGVGALPYRTDERARIGAQLLGVPLLEAARDCQVLSPCWRCVLGMKQDPAGEAACWPRQTELAGTCTCGTGNRVRPSAPTAAD
jgi:GNAT superfamily N-acetyltransferase